jgi:regulator of sirC expression with transglutaminase-like and TPR domain
LAITQRLHDLVTQSEAKINLAEAALLIAKDVYPSLNEHTYLNQLDEWASIILRGCEKASDLEKIVALNQFLFEVQGFTGQQHHFYDPQNSFLNKVMDHRTGIPITLSIIYLELGWRLNLPLEGVAFPGHFLVKLEQYGETLILDPFAGGIAVQADELVERLEELYKTKEALKPIEHYLVTASKKEILVRMLRNLKAIYLHQNQLSQVLWVLDRILLIAPDFAAEWRDRAMVHHKLECFRAALSDFECYLTLVPDAEDRDEIYPQIAQLKDICAHLH